ncbi:kinase-like domain-containing protein, partial [Russula vinacea]
EVAVKIGHIGFSPSKLSHEHDMYEKIAGSTGISPIHWYGKEDIYEVIVMDFLGTSLDDMISMQHFDHRKTFFSASQMVRSIYHYVQTYRDLTRLVLQLSAVDDDSLSVFLIDFGVAQLFREPATYLHNPYSTNHPIIGTLPFMSINSQQGHACSHHDDLESLVYTIIYLAHGKLPW